MKKFKLLVLVLIVALGVTACSTDKAPDDKDQVEDSGQGAGDDPVLEPDPEQEVDPDMEVDPEPEKDQVTGDISEGNEFLKDYYDNRAKKVSYDSVTDMGDTKIAAKYYIDGDNYRLETDDMISIYNSKKKEIYVYEIASMSGTIQSNEEIPPHITEFQEIQGLKAAELRDYEGEEELYVESVGDLEGKEIIAKSWISKKYYINLNGTATQDGEVVSTIKSSNITEDFDSEEMFKKPEGVKFKPAR